ncbi:hypothetical protein [Abyssogena phaseoliformis symbiont]|uniref:hypothetical protein n=1 Tax=Abyssogena phaseoliformis symbiont TaxID=596095 RepID=UPI001CEC1B2E|nr:hypothetical protein [Abyssogena phaseoliformis symbiont]
MAALKVKDKKIIQTIAKLDSEFHQYYYTGIFLERKARAWLKNPMSQSFAYEGLIEAIGQYEMAEKMAPSHCSDPVLRYNSCLEPLRRSACSLEWSLLVLLLKN